MVYLCVVLQANQRGNGLEEELEKEKTNARNMNANVNALTERVDSLKDQLHQTERALVQKDDELHYAAIAKDKTETVQVMHVNLDLAFVQWTVLLASNRASCRPSIPFFCTMQADCRRQVSQEQALRRRAELQMQEAINEVASASKDKQLAIMQAEDAQRCVDLEVKLRTQLAHEKDQV